MKIIHWIILLVSLFFLAWFVTDHISIFVINHGVFSTAIGNAVLPAIGRSADNWLIWFAILFGWLGAAVGWYYWKNKQKLGF